MDKKNPIKMSIFTKMIATDLKKINKQIPTNKMILKLGKKTKNNMTNTIKTSYNSPKLLLKYKINNVILEGKYLLRYNNLLYNNNYNNILYKDLIDSDYYKYDYMIKQKLSKCGLNRTRQLYGTCWLDSLINGIIFSPHLKNKFIQLLDYYRKVNEITDLKEYTSNINKNNIKLNTTVEKNHVKIFLRFISILYTVLCDTGIRNKKLSSHDNFIITNFAINVRNINSKKKTTNILKGDNIAYNSYYALEYILYIFNKMINKEPNLTYLIPLTHGNIYSMNNPYHINKLYFTINKMEQYITPGTEFNVNFKNIKININNNINNNNNIIRKFVFDSGELFTNIDSVDFIIFSCTDKKDPLYKNIPKEMEVRVDGKITLFKLESAGISIDIVDESIGHAVSGIICDSSYYIYDPYNNYFKIDWTDLSDKNTMLIKQYYRTIMASKFKKEYNKKTNKTILYTNDKYEPNVDIYIEYAIYYNRENNFSYKMKGCDPSRPM